MKGTLPLLAVLFAGCASFGPPPGPPDQIELRDVAGAAVRPADFRGKAVLLDFWASWCVPCRQSLPIYGGLYARNKTSGRPLVVLGVNEDDDAADASAFLKEHPVPYLVLLDPKRRSYEAYGVATLPTAILLDSSGTVRGRWSGFDAATAIAELKAIEALLAETPAK